MTLSPGTALQNGTYVLDAFGFEDSLGPTYLATHIPTGQVVQIKVLTPQPPLAVASPKAPTGAAMGILPAVRSQYFEYLAAIATLRHPNFPITLQGFEEGGLCYLVMDATVGQPLATWITPETRLPLGQIRAIFQQVHQALEALQPLGWQGLNLNPDQISWQANPSPASPPTPIILTGFGLPPALADLPGDSPVSPSSVDPKGQAMGALSPEAVLIPQLARLLYFLLLGEAPTDTPAPEVHLRHQRPGLPPEFETALQPGLSAPNGRLAYPALKDWMTLILQPQPQHPPILAPTSVPSQPVAPQDRLPVAAGGAAQTMPVGAGTVLAAVDTEVSPMPKTRVLVPGAPSRSPWPAVSDTPAIARWRQPQYALLITGLIASVAGLGFGLTLRLHLPHHAGNSRLNPEQSFPPLSDWNREDGDKAVADFNEPYVPDNPRMKSRPTRPDYEPYSQPPDEPIETPFEPMPSATDAAPWEDSPATEAEVAPSLAGESEAVPETPDTSVEGGSPGVDPVPVEGATDPSVSGNSGSENPVAPVPAPAAPPAPLAPEPPAVEAAPAPVVTPDTSQAPRSTAGASPTDTAL